MYGWEKVSDLEINSYITNKYYKELKNSSLNQHQTLVILKEIIASSILYQKNSNYDKKLFIEEKNVTERVKKTISLLISIVINETYSFKYSSSIFSPTNAFGRFQITSHTAAEAFYKLFSDKNITLQELYNFLNMN